MARSLLDNCGSIGIAVVASTVCIGFIAQAGVVAGAQGAAEAYGRCLAESNATDVACRALSDMLLTDRSGNFAIAGIVAVITLGTYIGIAFSRKVRPINV